MHVRKTLTVRNPLKPIPERLPCKLTATEELNLVKRTFALERTIEELNGQVAEAKAAAKSKVTELQDERGELESEKRKIREQVLQGEETRLVDCLLLEDVEAGCLYVFRLDTQTVVLRKDMRPEELEQLRQQKLPLGEMVTKTVDIPEAVSTVKRFDSDPPGVGQEEEKPKEAAAPPKDEGSNGHACTFNEGVCVTCGKVEGAAPAEAPPAKGKKGGKGKGYDTRAAAH